MDKKVHNKLIRDKIPAIIRADNATPTIRTLSEDEYRRELLKKLVEESTELLESDGSLDERADVAEVLRAIDALLGYTAWAVESARADKADARGGFDQKLFLEKVTWEKRSSED